MKKLLSLALSLMLVLAMLAGCSPAETADPGDNGQQSDTPREPSAEQKPIIFTDVVKTSTFDPLNYNITTDMVIGDMIYSPLLFYSSAAEDGVENNIVTAYEELTDAEGFLLTIREGVTFSNGEALTADDVAFTLEQYAVSVYQMAKYGNIASCEVVDDTHVRVLFKEPSNYFIPLLTNVWVLPQDYYTEVGPEGFNEAPIFSGPYIIEELDEATGNITFTRNPDYFGEPAKIDTVELRIIADSSVSRMALENGELNVSGINFRQLELLNAENLNLYSVPAPLFSYLCFNTEVEPTNDPIFRKALAYAIDQEAYNIATTTGYGTPLDSFWCAAWGENPAPDAEQYSYDPEKAVELLKQGGYETPYDLGTIYITGGQSDLGVVLQQNLADVGITCQLETVETSAWIIGFIEGDFTVQAMTGNELSYDPAVALKDTLSTSSINNLNFPRYSNSEVDALLDEAHSTKDEARKIEALGEALTIIQDECPALPILVQESTIGASKGLVCPEGSMNAQHYRFDLWYWAE